jgi:hypothetical protein
MKQSPLLSLIESITLEVLDEQKGVDIDKILAQALPELLKLLEPAMKQYISSKLKGVVQEVDQRRTKKRGVPTVGQVVNKTADIAKSGGRASQVVAARVASVIPGGADLGALYAAAIDVDVNEWDRAIIAIAFLNLLAGNFGVPGDIGNAIVELLMMAPDALPIVGEYGANKLKDWLEPLRGMDDAALIMWAKRRTRKAKLPRAKHYGEFEKWAALPAGSMTPKKAKRVADKSPSAPHNMFATTLKKQQESIMKKSELMKIIREEVEVILTNEEAVEMFDIDIECLTEMVRPSFKEMWDLLGRWIEDREEDDRSPQYDEKEKRFLAQYNWEQAEFDTLVDAARESGELDFLEEGEDKSFSKAAKEIEKKGTEGVFTAKAKKAGMGVQAYAAKVLKKGSKASTKTKRQAAFAKGAATVARENK